MKAILLTLLMVVSSFAIWNDNYTAGIRDTANIVGCSTNVTAVSDSIFAFGDFDKITIIMMVDDTTEAGFDSDSVKINWGYSPFTFCLDSGENLDTCWGPNILVDAIATAEFGNVAAGTVDSAGVVQVAEAWVDTTNCSGYAYQIRSIKSDNDNFYPYFKVYATGVAGNLESSPIVIRVQVIAKLYEGTRSK